ncbi:MAG: superoxide dismutase [Bacteroidaceae bacterium]|nr:superoxide dismutase [Bacteroidaceae bacterium]
MTSCVLAKIVIAALPYATDALAPVISEETINYHYGKHYQTYVDNLNAKIENTEWEGMCLEELVKNVPEGPLFNNAGQALNHQLYFLQFRPESQAKTEPSEKMRQKIDEAFGSVEKMKQTMSQSAGALFGSGWVWLESDDAGKLSISLYANGDNPVRHNRHPLVGVDVWEHAYYLDWQNRRTAHVDALWKIIDWSVVEERMPK